MQLGQIRIQISGATVSSGPVVSGIHEAAKLVDQLK